MSFEKQLKNFKITHIHAHFAFIATDIGYILSKLLNINFSFTAHAQDIFLNKQHIIGKMECATFVLTCTKYNLNYLNILSENRFKKKLHLIYHGIYGENKSFHHHQKPSPIVSKLQILTAARLVEKKGTIYLLKAIKLLTHLKRA